MASRAEQDQPELFITKMTKAARNLDYLRNERWLTAVASYSPRAAQAFLSRFR